MMIDINAFWMMILCILGSILLVVLIVLGVKMILTLNRINAVIDDVEGKVSKLNGVFNIIDTFTDSLATVSDKIAECISSVVRKIFSRNNKGEEEEYYGK